MKKVKIGERTTLQNLRANAAAQGYLLMLDHYWGTAEELAAAQAGTMEVTVECDEDTRALEVYAWETDRGVMIGKIMDGNYTAVYGKRAKWKRA